MRCGSLHLPGSAITPCSPSVTGPGRLNHSLMVSYQNNTNAATATSSASHAGSTNYLGSSYQKYFTIDKATLQITWSNPQAIDYRTALSSAQL